MKSKLYSFTLPRCLVQHSHDFQKQADHSHGLDWSERGEYCYTKVDHVLEDIAARLDERIENICFWAKGEEKATILSEYGYSVSNLEKKGCPKYHQLTQFPQSTLSKAKIFAQWTRLHESFFQV